MLRGVTITFVAAGLFHSVAVSAGEAGRFGGDRAVQAAAGRAHTAVVTVDGRLYTWGRGFYGQLGQGTSANMLVPTLVPAAGLEGSPVLMVACGSFHTLVVTRAGALYACGCGGEGQLGLNDRVSSRNVFERVRLPVLLSDARIVTASAGSYHFAAVTEDGALFTWGGGQDFDGRPTGLGHGDVTERLRPTLVAPGSMDGARIGRCRALAREHALAFAMMTHPRLGRAQAQSQAGAWAGGARRSQRLWDKAASIVAHDRCSGGVSGVARGGGGMLLCFGGWLCHSEQGFECQGRNFFDEV